MTTLKQICTELKVEPKAARRKLRKANGTNKGKAYQYETPADVKAVKKILAA
jgi:hypothetical protein